MSKKQHKRDHAARREKRDAARIAKASAPTSIDHPRRIYLRNGLYIFLTILCVIACLGVLLLLGFTGWWDGFLGSVLAIAVGLFGCMCLWDVGLLVSSCVAFGEGLVSAGKNDKGEKMIFHAAAVLRIEVRDREDNPLPPDRKVYKNVILAFVMESGRVNRKPLSRLTEGQLAALTEALANEKKN